MHHSLVATNDGKLLAFGRGDSGQVNQQYTVELDVINAILFFKFNLVCVLR